MSVDLITRLTHGPVYSETCLEAVDEIVALRELVKAFEHEVLGLRRENKRLTHDLDLSVEVSNELARRYLAVSTRLTTVGDLILGIQRFIKITRDEIRGDG